MVGFHGTAPEFLDAVLDEGLLREKRRSRNAFPGYTDLDFCHWGGCISIAERPEIAACYPKGHAVILVINLDRLPGLSEFVNGEARVHGDIPPDRISLYDGPPVMWDDSGHIDPATTHNHPACVDPPPAQGDTLDLPLLSGE